MEENFRRNREQYTVQLRKQNRQSLFKRRRTTNPNGEQIENQQLNVYSCRTKLIIDEKLRTAIQQIMDGTFLFTELQSLCLGLGHQNIEIRHRSAIGLRVIISQVQNTEVMQRAIDAGCVPILISYMLQHQYPQLQLQSTWVLTNIACGRTDQCQSIVDKGGLDAFLQVIKQNKPHIVQQALWGLGNIAGDTTKFRDLILTKGAVQIIIKAIQNSTNVSKLEQGAWVLSNLCRGTPRPKYEHIKQAIPILGNILLNDVVKQDILCGCLWAIAANSQSQKTRIQRVIEIKGFVEYLVSNCKKYAGDPALIPMLKILGNISNGNQIHTQELLKADCLSLFLGLLNHQKNSIRRETCWILSNICVGTASQLAQILANTLLLQKIAYLLQVDQTPVKSEICFIVANIIHCGGEQNSMNLLNKYNFFDNLVNILIQQQDGKCLSAALNLVFELLCLGKKVGGQENLIYRQFQSVPNLFERLAQLQTHPSEEVYKRLVKIFQNFFTIENDSV